MIDALEAGAHVLCEKPAAILVDDVERMIAARDRAGRIVQIGTMKRFDPAVEAACADAAHDDPADLLYVSVVAHDSEAGPYVDAAAIARGPVPAAAAAAARVVLLAQVEAAVGDAGPETLAAFVDGYLGSLVHHVDLVHALLAAGGEALPARVVGGAAWAGGTAVQGSCVLASGARWDTTWVQTLDLHEHEERTIVVGRRAISRLVLPSPWLQRAASVYERSWSDGERRLARGARPRRGVRAPAARLRGRRPRPRRAARDARGRAPRDRHADRDVPGGRAPLTRSGWRSVPRAARPLRRRPRDGRPTPREDLWLAR